MRILRCAGIGVLLSVVFASAATAAFDPRLIGIWRRSIRTESGGTGSLYMNLAADGSFLLIFNNETSARGAGTLTESGGTYHIDFSDGSKDDGRFERISPNEFHFVNGTGTTVYTRTVPFLAAPPPGTPLMLRTTERTPRELIRDRAAAENRTDRGSGDAAQLARALELCDDRQAAQALPILRHLALPLGNDVAFLYVDAEARLACADLAGARLDEDALLMQRPDLAEVYLLRALTTGRIGGIPRMKADLAVARSLDARLADTFEADHRDELAAPARSRPNRSGRDLADALLQTARSGSEIDALLPIARELRRAVNYDRRVPQERYQDGLRLRSGVVDAAPNDPQAWADLSNWLYQEASSKLGRNRSDPAEWINDLILSMRLANQSLALDPRNLTALSTKAWLLEQDNQDRDALTVAQGGLAVAPGYPRLAELQDQLMIASGIQAANAAARARARKYGVKFVPGWIITWSRGPTPQELEQAREFDAMSAANLSEARQSIFDAWRRYSRSIDEMNVAARYYDYVGRGADAVALWNRILKLDPDNVPALENLEEYLKTNGPPDQAFEIGLRLDNVYATTAAALTDRAARELTSHAVADAKKDLDRALGVDPADSWIYGLLSRVAAANNDRATALADLRCAEALETAAAELRGVRLDAETPVESAQADRLLNIWKGEQAVARMDGRAGEADRYAAKIDALTRRRITVEQPPTDRAGIAAEQRRKLQWLQVLIADREMEAAARLCLSGVANRFGQWHPETYGTEVDLEYPVYLYLQPRRYHYQLWHYFGPGTLQTYEAYARTHRGVDPRNPPSRGNQPNNAAR